MRIMHRTILLADACLYRGFIARSVVGGVFMPALLRSNGER